MKKKVTRKIEISVWMMRKTKSLFVIFYLRLQLPESTTFEDYVIIDNNVRTDKQLTETEILAELQRGPLNQRFVLLQMIPIILSFLP